MKRNDVTRDAMHVVHQWEASDSEAMDALIKLWVADSSKRHVDLLEETRALVEKLSETLKLPHPFKTCLTKGPSWRPLPANWDTISQIERPHEVTDRESLEIGWNFIRRNSKPLSNAWFVGEVSMRVDGLVLLPDDQRIDAALRLGFLIGQWSSRRNLPNVARGKTVRKGASEGGKERSRALAVEKTAILEAIKTQIDKGHSIRRASALAHAKGFGTSPGANRQLWMRRAPKKTPT